MVGIVFTTIARVIYANCLLMYQAISLRIDPKIVKVKISLESALELALISSLFSSVDAYPVLKFILIIATIGTVASFLKIIYYSFIKFENAKAVREGPLSMRLTMLVLASLCIVLGIMPNLLLDYFILPAANATQFEITFDFSRLLVLEVLIMLIIVFGILLLKWSIVESDLLTKIRNKIMVDLNSVSLFIALSLAVIAVIFRIFV
ncbi:MAG: hypothetical protein QME47_00350 [Candidatus Thermoplasmatota archaeon]|nr:hypothetical protein [Candidatus Thermoplasmatota archaeon]